MNTQRNMRRRLVRVLLVAALPVLAATGVVSTAAAATPQPTGVATYWPGDGDYFWCWYGVWYPCYDHDRYGDNDWFHHRFRNFDHDRDRHDYDRHDRDHDGY